MRADFSQTSQFYRAIADLLQHLEQHALGSFDVMDGGQTIEIQHQVLLDLRTNQTWQQLEATYEQVGGCISTQESDWEIINGGVQLNDIAAIFEVS